MFSLFSLAKIHQLMVTGIAPCAGFPSKKKKKKNNTNGHGSVSNKVVPSLKF